MLEKDRQDSCTSSRLLNVSEVAHMLHVHPNTIRLWSKIGVLKSFRIGKRRDYRFDPADIETFLYKEHDKPN